MYAIIDSKTNEILGLSDVFIKDRTTDKELSKVDVNKIATAINTKFYYKNGAVEYVPFTPELPSELVKETARKQSREEEILNGLTELKLKQEIINQAVMALIGGI